MTDHQPEQAKANPEAEESVKQKGLSKEAWAAVSAIAVALIGGIVVIMTAIIPKLPLDKPSSSPTSSVSTSSPSVLVSPSVDSQAVTADAIASKWGVKQKPHRVNSTQSLLRFANPVSWAKNAAPSVFFQFLVMVKFL